MKKRQQQQKKQADTDGSPSGFLFLLFSAVRLKGACTKCDVKRKSCFCFLSDVGENVRWREVPGLVSDRVDVFL